MDNSSSNSREIPKLLYAPANSGSGNLDFIDLDDIFAVLSSTLLLTSFSQSFFSKSHLLDHLFPPDLDFSAFLQAENLYQETTKHSPNTKNGDSNYTYDMNQFIGFHDPVNDRQPLATASRISLASDINVSAGGVIMIPPSMPRIPQAVNAASNNRQLNSNNSNNSSNSKNQSIDGSGGSLSATKYQGADGFDDDDDDDDDDGYELGEKRGRKTKIIDPKDMTEVQKVERRERNREHAKRSRIRKKVLLDSLQDQLTALRNENVKLRRVVVDRLPQVANKIFEECTTEESMLLVSDDNPLHLTSSSGDALARPLKQQARILMEPDFRLIQALITSQQNFVLSDPSLPDNPIVYASDGFCKLSGYKKQDILGRNCRFLQGPGTDQAAVDIIRQGVSEGRDISVCLLNYKADGSPFWNQFFVAALRDADGAIVNFVGVQCEVNTIPISQIKDRVKKLPIPDSL